jgi:predicted nucleotidyltransferase
VADVPDAIADTVRRFLAALGRSRRIDAAYVYGSHASGSAGPWSDIDVAVVSPDFSADLFEEQVALLRLAAAIDDRIEARPFRPSDFGPGHPLVHEILSHGVRIG